MRKFSMTLAAAAAVLVTINMAANAQAPVGAGIHALVQNSTPVVKQVACQGPGGTAGPAMSEPAAHIVAGAVRATDRIIGYAFSERLPLAASRLSFFGDSPGRPRHYAS
jgi:hypothetical protein